MRPGQVHAPALIGRSAGAGALHGLTSRGPAAAYPPLRRGRLYRCDLSDGARQATVAFRRLSLSYAVSVGSARLTAPAAGV
jgi:hypothetical protein